LEKCGEMQISKPRIDSPDSTTKTKITMRSKKNSIKKNMEKYRSKRKEDKRNE